MPQQYRLPDGSVIDVPDDASPEDRARIARAIQERFGGGVSAPPSFNVGAPPPQASLRNGAPAIGTDEWFRSRSANIETMLGSRFGAPAEEGGIASLREPPSDEYVIEEGGTKLGAAWEGIKSLPKGTAQAALMVAQGAEGLRTPHKDTALEKSIRAKLQDLQESIDPKYRDSNLVHVAMGLGQYGGLLAAGLTPGLQPVALASGMLMMAGDAAGRLADYEERTGEDVSTGKEMLALGAGFGLGVTEMLPLAKFIPKGLVSKGIAKATGEAAEKAALMTSKQFRASLLPTTIRQARQEALQEGLTAYGQSVTARLVYDEDALATAGSESLREALIGGEVGAVGNVLMRMGARAFGKGSMRYGSFRSGVELNKAVDRMVEAEGFDEDFIENLISGPDIDGITQGLIDSGVAPENVESHPDMVAARGLQELRANIQVNPDTGLSRVREQARESIDRQRTENEQYKESDKERWASNEAKISADEVGFETQMGKLLKSIKLVESQNEEKARFAALSEEDQAAELLAIERARDPNVLLTEQEIDNEQARINERQEEVRSQLQRVEAEVGAESDVYQALQAESIRLDDDVRGNEALRERLKVEPLPAPTMDDMAGNVTYGAQDVELQLQLALRPTQQDIETQAQFELNRQRGELGARIERLRAPLRATEAKLATLRKTGITDQDRRKLRKLEKRRDENQRETEKLSEESGAAIGITEADLEADPEALEQFRSDRQNLEQLAVERVQIAQDIDALSVDRLIETAEADVDTQKLGIAALEGGPVVHDTGKVEDIQGNVVDRTIATSGMDVLASSEYQDQNKKNAVRKWKKKEQPLAGLAGRLVTQEQRDNLAAFLGRPETDVRMTAEEVRRTIDGILGGGLNVVYESTGKKIRKEGYSGEPAREGDVPVIETDVGFHYPMPVERPATPQERNNAGEQVEEATNEILSWWSQVGIDEAIDEQARDKPPLSRSRRRLTPLYSSLGILGNEKLLKIVRNLRKTGFNVNENVLAEVLRAKNFNISSKKGGLFKSTFFRQLVGDTLGLRVPMLLTATSWGRLSRGKKEAVLSRLLRTEARPDTTKAGQDDRVYRRELRRLQDGPDALPKTAEQKRVDADNLAEAKKRFEVFRKKAQRILSSLGLKKLAIEFTADVNDVMSQVEDVVINGAFETELNTEGETVFKLDSKGKKIFRPVYKDGAVASLDKHGMRIVFNLSQIMDKYADGIDTNPDELIRETLAHEGTHLLFLNNDLTTAERRALEVYGRKKRVPKEVDPDAHEADMTWHQWIKEMYSDRSEAYITEETSVRILDNLAMGKIPEAQSAGIVGKIKRQAVDVFKAMVGASQDGDILPVMRIFEDIQSGAIAERRETMEKAEGLRGASALLLVERAKPSDIKRLKVAIKAGDQVEIDRISDEIVRSREEFTDSRTDEERLVESLTSELMARKEIEGTPDFISPLLNAQALEDGDIDIDSLNAYFRFRDGRKPAYRMLEGVREKRERPMDPRDAAMVQDDVDRGLVSRSDLDVGERIIGATDAHNRLGDAYTGSTEDFKKMLENNMRQRFRTKFVDRRFALWKSSKRAYKREIGKYHGVLSRLAENSAISAWRFADNAMNFIPGVMKHGMIVYADGGFKLIKLTGPTGLPVKGLYDIFGPLAQMGGDAEVFATGYMAAKRIVSIHAKLEGAKQERDRLRFETSEGATEEQVLALRRAERNFQEWEQSYDEVNPWKKRGERKKGEKPPPKERQWNLEEEQKRIVDIEKEDTELRRTTVQFGKDYFDFNYQLVQFGIDVGLISRERGEVMQELSFIPFYRDMGWENTDPMSNSENEVVAKKKDREAKESSDAWEKMQDAAGEVQLRGEPLINKQIRGSLAPISGDLFGNIQRNVQALIRDGMINVATTRTMRDEVADGTAYLVIENSQEDLNRLAYLKKSTTKKTADMEIELAELEVKTKRIIKEAQAQRIKLDADGFSPILVTAMGISTDLNNENKTTGIEEGGVAKTYRVLDPEVSRAVMSVGFSPKQAIEDFFGKAIKNERLKKGLTMLVVGPSKFLREMVVRSPPFIAKNIIRDSWQASVVYGGGPTMFFKAMANFVKPTILKEAEERGLGIAVDWQADPDDPVALDVRRHLKKEARGELSSPSAWLNPKDWAVNLWDVMGNLGKRSEVATRMAVYDHTMAKTGNGDPAQGNSAEALKQAIEIINYGRRGSSPMFALMTTMSPFLNGRIQGLDVTYRTHMGVMDAPGLFGEKGITDVDSVKQRLFRTGTAVRRGSLFMAATLLYYLMVKDDEEYKNTREDLKNDWWLIPLPNGLHLKIPIPFEVGLLYKVIPEQIARMYFEEEHDIRDVRDEMRRQLTGSLKLDLRPQFIRPMLDAWSNKDAYQRDAIVPQWMEDTVMASEQYNPYTGLITRLVGDKMGDVPFLKHVDFLNSPMKLEYMLRQYMGTIGSYALITADAITRSAMDESKVGTAADFGFDTRTLANMPMIGDLLYDPQKGGGFQEDFYEAVEDINTLVSTLGQIEERRGPKEAREFEEEHKGLFDAKRRLQYFERRMKHYRMERNRLFERTDLSDDDKRRQLFRMFETRDDMLAEMVKIMADIRDERGFMEAALGTRP